jgi:predicted nucleic acid-binding protein
MSVRVYVDTNVLIYARDSRFPAKQAQAQVWLRTLARASAMTLGVQVLKEFHAVASHKLGLGRNLAALATRDLFAWCETSLGLQDVETALQIEGRYQTSWWDALNLASAAAAGCSHFLTEDAQSAPVIEGIKIVPMFSAKPADLGL